MSINLMITMLSSSLELFLCKKVYDYSSSLKTNLKLLNFMLVSFTLLLCYITYIDIDDFFIVSTCIIISIAFYKINYDVKLVKSIIVTLAYWMMVIAISSFSVAIVINITSINSLDYLYNSTIHRYLAMAIEKIFLCVIVYMYSLYNIKSIAIKNDFILIIIPITCNIVSFFIFYDFVGKIDTSYMHFKKNIYVIGSILLISSIALLAIIKKIINDSKKQIEINALNERLILEYKYYKNIEYNQDFYKEIYHDMKNHIICIKELNKINSNSNDYICELESRLNKNNYFFETGSKILDILLIEKNKLCLEQNIDLKCSINVKSINFIEHIDQCSIFSNILDNAIEACKKINPNDRKYILLNSAIKGEMLIIKCINTKCNDIKISNHKILTTKNNRNRHGIGLKSVSSSLDKYGGTVAIEYNDKEFIIKILIPIIKKVK